MSHDAVSWPALLALGAGHGINPAMGWLFAVALGLQAGSRRAVWAALGPLAVGHAAAIAVAIIVAEAGGLVLPLPAVRWVVAALLVGLGVLRLVRARHFAYGGMCATARELATWSFLMASAHGAGLMVLPLVLRDPTASSQGHRLAAAALGPAALGHAGLVAALIHSAGYLVMTSVIAALVYERFGTGFLRRGWINLDLLWAVALVVAGVATVAL